MTPQKIYVHVVLGIALLFGQMCHAEGVSSTAGKVSSGKQANESSTEQLYFGGDILTMRGEEPGYLEALVVNEDKIAFAGALAEAGLPNAFPRRFF